MGECVLSITQFDKKNSMGKLAIELPAFRAKTEDFSN